VSCCGGTPARPAGWAPRVLESGRAFLLIDGVDEIPQADRERTREWLHELLGAYPNARCVVTVRPSAVRDDYLRREGFTPLSLLPMGRNDTAAFIAQWHDAARAESQEETEHLDQLQRSLLETVSSNPSIARLAENPLMCALICALHRDQQARLPQDRKSLYDSALELLLVRRDTHRSIQAPEGIELSKEAQLRLLSRIAAWLILQRQSEADQEDVVDGILAEILPGIREAQRQGAAPDILRYLLVRSGVLHAPTEDSVAFIHRTFQDYLGAKALQENRCPARHRRAGQHPLFRAHRLPGTRPATGGPAQNALPRQQ
jgi:predicted NACHT family NTPase